MERSPPGYSALLPLLEILSALVRRHAPFQIKQKLFLWLSFRDGNYVKGKELLPAALERDRREPLTLTLAAAIAYLNEDWAGYKRYAEETLRAAQALTGRDPCGGISTNRGTFPDGWL